LTEFGYKPVYSSVLQTGYVAKLKYNTYIDSHYQFNSFNKTNKSFNTVTLTHTHTHSLSLSHPTILSLSRYHAKPMIVSLSLSLSLSFLSLSIPNTHPHHWSQPSYLPLSIDPNPPTTPICLSLHSHRSNPAILALPSPLRQVSMSVGTA
jgi:hypothetical protein